MAESSKFRGPCRFVKRPLFLQRKRMISWMISVIASTCSQAEQSAGGQDLGVFIQRCKFEMKVVIFLNL